MNDFKFTQEQMQDAMFRATDWGHIPYSEQRFIILQFIESLKVVSERTYTEAEMKGAFGAGIEFENDRCFNPNMDKRHDTDLCYSKFLKSLNTSKPW